MDITRYLNSYNVRQIDRQIDRYRQLDRQIDRQVDRYIDGWIDILYIPENIEEYNNFYSKIDFIKTEIYIYMQTHWYNDSFLLFSICLFTSRNIVSIYIYIYIYAHNFITLIFHVSSQYFFFRQKFFFHSDYLVGFIHTYTQV